MLVERLADEVGRAELHGLDYGRGSALARQHDHRHLAIDLLEGGQRFEPVHRAGHHDVEDHRGRPLDVVALDRFLGAAERDRLVAPIGKKRAQEVAHREVVVDDHDLGTSVCDAG